MDESTPSPQPPQPETPSATPTAEELIAEAEERGYRRGLNERIEREMSLPGVWESGHEPPADGTATVTILSSPRRSIWDM